MRSLGRELLHVVNPGGATPVWGSSPREGQLVLIEGQLAEMTVMRDEGLIGAIGISAVTEELA